MVRRCVAAIDQGTTSTRCLVFDASGDIVARAQQEHRQFFPQPGWVEHDPEEIWTRTCAVLAEVTTAVGPDAISAIGITNQRETTIVWDRTTGEAIYPAVVWQDIRTEAICREIGALGGGVDRYSSRVGLPLATYFAGPKITWILRHVPGAAARAKAGELAAGTVDSYLVWRLTGGPNGGVHVTDVSNASRTMLMDLRTLEWDPRICADLDIPPSMLPRIRSSSEVVGVVAAAASSKVSSMTPPAALAGIPIAGILGDQQAATFGQACLEPGQSKNTYGTGNFLLLNTGREPVFSSNGLLTTVCFQLGDQPAVYALEGSIAVTGALVQWLRDNVGLIDSASDIEALAASVPDNGGAYIVPAFSGLFAPHWRPDARGTIVGLTRFVTKAHLARAALEAVAFQTSDVVDAMNSDAAIPLREVRVDGGMVSNQLLMQFQADILGIPVVRPQITETTALGAAYAAGLAVGLFESLDVIRQQWAEDTRFEPSMDKGDRRRLLQTWRKAVSRSLDWAD